VGRKKVGMMSQAITEVLDQWVAAINAHDVVALTALMAADHLFVDSLGNRVEGVRSMEAGWRGYFAMCPDYWIRVDQVMAEATRCCVLVRPEGRLTPSHGGYRRLGRR
jgi:ketosteroid isomerase-like protein